jgi:hypothetical protein
MQLDLMTWQTLMRIGFIMAGLTRETSISEE